ncbi:MAG: DMT family transporter [Clostridiaceae bacterium]|nr:DMT family transporter [Clostridiaceae bacterium]
MEERNSVLRVYLIMLVGVIAVSFSAIFVRNTTAPSTIVAMYRMVLTFFLFVPVMLTNGREKITQITKKEVILCGLSGIFLALHFSTWIASLSYTTVASSTVLVGLQPIFTAIIGYFLYKERLSRNGIIGMAIAIFGGSVIGILDFQVSEGHLYGDFLALMGGFFGALYILIGRTVRKKVSTLVYTFLVYGSCTLILVIVNIYLRTPIIGYSSKDYILFLAMAIVCTVGGHTIFNWSLKHVEANKVSTAMLGEPVGATFLAIILLKEVPNQWQIVSGILIITGLYIFMTAGVREHKLKEKIAE